MKKLSNEQIECAVEWWSSIIGDNPKFDNGDETEAGIIGMGMARMLSDKHVPTREQLEVFKIEFKKRLEEATHTYLDVDYHPSEDLYIPAEIAGIHASRFPIKTYMEFRDGGVEVSYGYSAPLKKLL